MRHPFYDSLTKTELETMIDVMSQAAKLIMVEEDQRLEMKEKKGKAIMEVMEPRATPRLRQMIDNTPRFQH